MHLDLALLLSEAKGELRFYKSEVLKDVLYYGCGGNRGLAVQNHDYTPFNAEHLGAKGALLISLLQAPRPPFSANS